MKSPTCVSQPIVVQINRTNDDDDGNISTPAKPYGLRSRNSLKSWVESSTPTKSKQPSWVSSSPLKPSSFVSRKSTASTAPSTPTQVSKPKVQPRTTSRIAVSPTSGTKAPVKPTTSSSTLPKQQQEVPHKATPRPKPKPQIRIATKPVKPSFLASHSNIKKLVTPKPYVSKVVGKENLQEQIINIKNRLCILQKQKEADKELYNLRLQKAKIECKDKLLAIYKPSTTQKNHQLQDILGETKKSIEEQQVEENNKMISYLRDENRTIRTQMEFLSKQMKELSKKNKSLEQANEAATLAKAELDRHVQSLQVTHDKLIDTVSKCKSRLDIMKAEYNKRNDHYMSEVYGRSAYENGLCKILPEIDTRCTKYGSKDYGTGLAESIMSIAQQAEEESKRGCDMVLDEFDLKSLPTVPNAPRKSITEWKNNLPNLSASSMNFDSDSDDE